MQELLFALFATFGASWLAGFVITVAIFAIPWLIPSRKEENERDED